MMNNKDDKETIPKEKYIPFHRERAEPTDCYSRHEVDKKLKAQQEAFNKKLQEQKDELEESSKEELEKVKTQFDTILKKISQKFQEYYTQEKVDQFFNVIQSRSNILQQSFDMLEKHIVKLEELVFEYLDVTDIGRRVGDKFVLNEKKKGFWKK